MEAVEAVDYPALRKPRITSGVGGRTAVMIWTASMMAVILIGLPYGLLALPVSAVVHGGLAWFFKQEPEIFNLYLTHELVANDLTSGLPSHGDEMVSRARGYGRNIPL